MELKQIAIVLVDISGYTHFLQYHQACIIHAEQIITELLEAVIDTAEYPLTLNKLEGDAALLYAEISANPTQAAQDIFKQVQQFFNAFKHKQQHLIDAAEGGCPCTACRQIDALQLKAFLHYGEVLIKRIRNFEELAGEPVILAHRWLKNSIGASEYILLTPEFQELSGSIEGMPSQQHQETYEDMGTVMAHVYYPELLPLTTYTTPPMSKPTGHMESMRLLIKSLWHRLWHRHREFGHLPD